MKTQITAAIYVRVSTVDQNDDMQFTELRQYAERMGWKIVEYAEKRSSVKRRPVFQQMMDDARLRKIDIVLCWKLDRFARSLQQLIDNIRLLDSYGVRFICVTQSIDTDKQNPASRLMLHILGAVAEFERGIIIERVKAGVAQYRNDFESGKIGKERHSRSGRDLAPHRPKRIFRRDEALKMRKAGKSFRNIAAELGLPLSTVVDAIKAYGKSSK
jgi:DNA invertase Pin-like site-specific DNA recombinase